MGRPNVAQAIRSALADWSRQPGAPPPLRRDEPLLLAVSGGADSLAMLHLFATADLHPFLRLHVAHFDHRLRPDSGADARFVAETAAQLGVACHQGAGDVAAAARAAGKGTEAAARRLRYRFLAETARDVGARFVLTGHQQDDQAETVLLHLLRGSGLAGLRGMLPLTPLAPLGGPAGGGRWLGRPLLDVSAADLRAYCRVQGLDPRQDASNDDTTLLRNRLRREILPLLAAINPRIDRRLAALAAQVAADHDLLDTAQRAALADMTVATGAGWLRLNLAAWRAAHLSRRRGVLRQAWAALAPTGTEAPGFDALEAACRLAETGEAGQQAMLPGDVAVTLGYAALALAAPGAAPPLDVPRLRAGVEQPLLVPGRIRLADGWVLTAEPSDAPHADVVGGRDLFSAYLSCDPAALTVRGRRPGDRLAPLGMGGSGKKLKDVFNQRRVPPAGRDLWPLVCCGGEIAWVPGGPVGVAFAVPAGGRATVRLRCYREPGGATD